MEILDEKFEQTKNDAKKYYSQLNSIECPYLKKQIQFNALGFEHLLSKSWNRGRSHVEQYTRLRLLPKVVEILQKSHTLQEYDERHMLVRQKINSRWEMRPKMIRYFVFIAVDIRHEVRFKIVIKEIEGGLPFFWSLYPSWSVKNDNTKNKKKIFYTGNLEED